MNPIIYENLVNFVPQEGVVYKNSYENILKDEKIKRDALLYLSQESENVYTHINNRYLAVIRKLFLEDNFFVFYHVRSLVDEIKHEFVVQMCANTDYDYMLYKTGKVSKFLEMRARGHIKTYNNENLAMQCVLEFPEESLLFIAFRRESSSASMLAVKEVFEMDEVKHAFSDILFDNPEKDTVWAINKGLLLKRKKKSKDLTVSCCGFYQGSNTGGHYRFLFLDDIMTKEMRDSAHLIKFGKEQFDNIGNLCNFGNEKVTSMIRVSGTPYAHDDVVMHVHDRVHKTGTLKGHQIYKTRKIREADDNDVPCFVTIDEHNYNKGSDNYNSQQQLDPSPDMVDRLLWEDVIITDYVPDNLLYFQLVDPAGDIEQFHKGDKDNWCSMCVGVSLEKDINGMSDVYITDLVARQMTESEAPSVIGNMFLRNQEAQSLGIEQGYSGYLATAVANYIKRKGGRTLSEKDNSLVRLKAQTRGNKKNNINSRLAHRFKFHKIHVLDSIPFIYRTVMKAEVETFPTGLRDDVLDTLSYIDIMLEKLQFDYRSSRYARSKIKKVIPLHEHKERKYIPEQQFMYF